MPAGRAKPTRLAASAAAPRRARVASQAGFRAKIRMYRQGLGDCFLVTLPRADKDFFLLIDCGVILGTPDAATIMTRVVEDVAATTSGTIDLVIATHEHWDHLSGFIQARDAFSKLRVREVWLAWTEDPKDELAATLRRERTQALAALRLAANRMRLAGDEDAAEELSGLLEFFGASAGASTSDALEIVRKLAPNLTYCRPDRPPFAPPDLGGARFYVLGPPHDERLIRQTLPHASDPETYGLFLDQVTPALAAEDDSAPFASLLAIPTTVAKEIDFFKSRYWGAEDWRQIEASWLGEAPELALQLDSRTNNTSLALAIELPDKDVLLFAADAQVGNWLSWQDLAWTLPDGTKTTGPDLLARTVFYKVGHHGSHNATLREKGLEMMGNLRAAMIPVDHAVALKKRWGNMPLPELLDALDERTRRFVLRSDKPAPRDGPYPLVERELYFELTL